MRRSDGGHVGSVEHHRDHVVRQDVEELLRHVVLIKDYQLKDLSTKDSRYSDLAKTVLKRKIELVGFV